MAVADFDVAVSFADEDRPYVVRVVREMQRLGVRVFYDADQSVALWGKDLVAEFDDVFQQRCRSVVVFISRHYVSKDWTRHELRSALAHAIRVRHVYVLPARFDDSPLPGLPDTVRHVDCNTTTPEELARMVVAALAVADRAALPVPHSAESHPPSRADTPIGGEAVPADPNRTIEQHAEASDQARIYQAGGDQNITER